MDEVRRLSSLAWPVILGQLGLVGMGTVDLLMIGPLGRDATAAVGLGNTWSFAVVIVALGAATGIDPPVTQAYGSGNPRRAGVAAARGMVLAALLCVPVMLLHVAAEPALRLLGQPEAIIPEAATYTWIVALSMPPMIAFGVLRQLLQGGGVMRPAMWVVLVGNLVNVAGNAWLIGPYGVAGVAWSTVIVRWFMFAALAVIGIPQIRAAWPDEPVLRLRAIGALAGIALPVGLQVGLEVWAFNAAGFVAGWFGAGAMAAHVAALNAIALAFMIASGLSAAAATRVGNLVGAGLDWRRAAVVALGLVALVMACTGAFFLSAPELVGRAYNPDPEVVALIVAILPVGALFGLFDGTQVVAFGILRGLGDTRVPSLANLVGYWLIGLPLAAFLAVGMGWELLGVWVGLAVSLVIVSALLLVRIVWHTRAPHSVQPVGEKRAA